MLVLSSLALGVRKSKMPARAPCCNVGGRGVTRSGARACSVTLPRAKGDARAGEASMASNTHALALRKFKSSVTVEKKANLSKLRDVWESSTLDLACRRELDPLRDALGIGRVWACTQWAPKILPRLLSNLLSNISLTR